MALSKPLMVVAIDFGTVYSGYAFSTLSDYKKDPTNVKANQVWSASPGLLSEKTPTCLLLTPEGNFEYFGYEAEDEYASLALKGDHKEWYFFKRFKMQLYGEKNIDKYMDMKDEYGNTLPAIQVFSESIGYLMNHFLKKRDDCGIPIEDNEILWVLTVPAIWNDSAKRFMRDAAVEAGIESTRLKIALEPEAASLYCLHAYDLGATKADYKAATPGTKYMIIDLGGGTADITVHKVKESGNRKELCKASGGVWGGTAVDDGYIKLLTRIVGGPTMHQFRTEHMYDYIEMMREFEVRKRNVNLKTRSEFAFRLPVKLNEICYENNEEYINSITESRNFPFRKKIIVQADKLIIKAEIIKHLFKTVIDQIVDHVKDIVADNNLNDLSMMILVGGFSESPLVQEMMKNEFQTVEQHVVVGQEPSLSIVKGAVMYGHNTNLIHSRILRYTYGTSPHTTFIPDKHPETRRFEINGRYRIKVFKPFIEAGADVEVGHTITKRYTYSAWHFNEDSVLQVFVSSNPGAEYPDDQGCEMLKQIPIGRILPELPPDRRIIYVDYDFGDTEVEMIVREEETEFVYNEKFNLIE